MSQHRYTHENAAENGRKSVALRLAQAEIVYDIVDEKPNLLSELVKAAYGQGKWAKLAQTDRLKALVKAVEYAHGKPLNAEREKTESTGFSIV